MAYKKDIKPLLKELGLTWEDMDKLFEELCETNAKCRAIKNSGKSWNDLNINVIRGIPTQKQRDEEARRKKEEEEKAEELRKKKEEDSKKYYSEHFEELMVEKIDKNESLTERELKTLALDYDIERSYGSNRRWSRTVISICELCNRFFSVCWEEGLTESQEDGFYDQPKEVFPHTKINVVKTTMYSEVSTSEQVSALTVEKAKIMFSDLVDGIELPDTNAGGLSSGKNTISLLLG